MVFLFRPSEGRSDALYSTSTITSPCPVPPLPLPLCPPWHRRRRLHACRCLSSKSFHYTIRKPPFLLPPRVNMFRSQRVTRHCLFIPSYWRIGCFVQLMIRTVGSPCKTARAVSKHSLSTISDDLQFGTNERTSLDHGRHFYRFSLTKMEREKWVMKA